MTAEMPTITLLIKGARVYDRALDIHRPAVRDVIVEGNRIASVIRTGRIGRPQVGDCSRRRSSKQPGCAASSTAPASSLIPGLVNAHYHSYDVL